MVLEQDAGARDASGFAKKLGYIRGVVQNIHEQADIEGAVRKRELRAIEAAAWDPAGGARSKFNAFDRDIRPMAGEESGNRAVAAANIQHGGRLREHRGQRFGDHTGSAAKHHGVMASGDPGKRP